MPKKVMTQTKKPSQRVTLEEAVMTQISNNEISMKPRWYFLLGSLLMSAGLLGLSIGAIFMLNLSFFLFRQHGPMGQWRLQLMLQTFPWWIPALAVFGMVAGIYFLKKFDFSYKKNFSAIVLAFIATIILAAFLIDVTGINDTWFGKGPMRGLNRQGKQQRFMQLER